LTVTLELDSGYNYLVKMRNENAPLQEFCLAERLPMSATEWLALKNTLLAQLNQ